jgi:hypothetical protein
MTKSECTCGEHFEPRIHECGETPTLVLPRRIGEEKNRGALCGAPLLSLPPGGELGDGQPDRDRQDDAPFYGFHEKGDEHRSRRDQGARLDDGFYN